MPTNVDEIGPDIYRLSTLAPDIGRGGFTLNQLLIDDDEPLLLHTGHRSMSPSLPDAIGTVLPSGDSSGSCGDGSAALEALATFYTDRIERTGTTS